MTINSLHSQHERQFAGSRFVYPVLSRRSGGISIGVNLNPDKVCNFHCVYCQVDRVSQAETRFVDTPQLLEELERTLELVCSGRLFETDKFRGTPAEARHLTDIAFSGDGEPTTHRNFDEIVNACADLRDQSPAPQTQLVLITNASMFHREHVRRALRILGERNGKIWAKLDAGTEDYYEQVNRAPFKFGQILSNITEAARAQPLVIQSLFQRLDGAAPDAAEIDAFCERLNTIRQQGGKIEWVQIYTIARPPAESYVSSLTDPEVDAIVQKVRQNTGLSVSGFYGQ
jgi:wyosine [tRNA(Phe)-imidazoG37] synthetase (radical SAM superfamily)